MAPINGSPPSGHPLVSVLTTVYNHEPYIRECVESILAQTLTDFEMIIVDDGSTDGTAKALTEFQDPRLRILSQPLALLVAGRPCRTLSPRVLPP